jgi:hypothetical protein
MKTLKLQHHIEVPSNISVGEDTFLWFFFTMAVAMVCFAFAVTGMCLVHVIQQEGTAMLPPPTNDLIKETSKKDE